MGSLVRVNMGFEIGTTYLILSGIWYLELWSLVRVNVVFGIVVTC